MQATLICQFWRDISVSIILYLFLGIDVILSINSNSLVFIYLMKSKKYWLYLTFGVAIVGCFVWLVVGGKIVFQQWVAWSTWSLGETTMNSLGPVVTWTLLISPYDTEGDIFDLLASTKYTLKMRFYQITDKKTQQLLRNLSQLGVDIDLIVENNIYGEGGTKDFIALQKALKGKDIEIRTDEKLWTNYVHAKAMVIDDSRFMISTANLSYPSFRQNREYRFISSYSGVTQSLVTIFAKDRTWDAIMSGDIDDHLLVCPINCRKIIEEAISGAQSSIMIETQYIEDQALVSLLQKKNQEVDMRLIVWEYQWKKRLDNLSTWTKIFDDLYLHAKNILIDEKTLIMWSMNLSSNALDHNREFGIVIDDPRVIKQFKGQFERDWKQAKSLKL